jgi:hypothetical protein
VRWRHKSWPVVISGERYRFSAWVKGSPPLYVVLAVAQALMSGLELSPAKFPLGAQGARTFWGTRLESAKDGQTP